MHINHIFKPMFMMSNFLKLSFSSALILILFAGTTLMKVGSKDSKHFIIAYVMGNRGAKVTADDAKKLTHINYAFADVVNGKVVEISKRTAENLKELNQLKEYNPELKVLISIGGWSRSKGFSDAVFTEQSREIFAKSCIDFMLSHNLDGVDLDWEYPGQRGDGNKFRAEDKVNFTLALALIRKKLDKIGKENDKQYLLTIATGANQRYLDNVEMKNIVTYLDFINIMTYDFHGGHQKVTGHHTNLYESETDPDKKRRSTAGAVEEHLKAGVPARKLVVGAAFYGKGWKGSKEERHGLHQQSSGVGFTLPYRVLIDSIDRGNYIRFWDEAAKAPYAWSPKMKIFITYDDQESIREKSKYVAEKGLLGIMYWEYSGDNNGDLLEVMHENLNN